MSSIVKFPGPRFKFLLTGGLTVRICSEDASLQIDEDSGSISSNDSGDSISLPSQDAGTSVFYTRRWGANSYGRDSSKELLVVTG